MKKMRLDKLLSNMGYGSRKEIKEQIKCGLVTVNNNVEKKSGKLINPKTDILKINQSIVLYKEFIYLLMNKPPGVISAVFDKYDTTVIDLLPQEYLSFNLFPVGRLDKDTEGLLLLTNNGQLTHNLLSPKKHVPKKYYVSAEGEIDDEKVEKLKEGVIIQHGYLTQPAEVEVILFDEASNASTCFITIHEGKFHQVKQMFESVGSLVKYLKRVQMGPLSLDDNLALGEFRELTNDEVQLLLENK